MELTAGHIHSRGPCTTCCCTRVGSQEVSARSYTHTHLQRIQRKRRKRQPLCSLMSLFQRKETIGNILHKGARFARWLSRCIAFPNKATQTKIWTGSAAEH